MGCNLNKFKTYDIGRVIHDNSNGSYSVQLVNAPQSCPDNSFNSKKAVVKIISGVNPTLTYDVVENHPVIMVPRKQAVEEIGTSIASPFIAIFILCMLGSLIYLLFFRRKSAPEQKFSRDMNQYVTSRQACPLINSTLRSQPSVPYYNQPAIQPTTIVNNSGSSSNGLIEGMILNEMLHDHHSHDTYTHETVIEREVTPSYSSDSSDSSNSYSSDSSDSSYSSDSSDSYSSDSDSSFSSDY